MPALVFGIVIVNSSGREGDMFVRALFYSPLMILFLAMQLAICKGHASLQQLESLAPQPVLDLRPFLGHKVLALLPEPLHVIGFSDEEGVR